MGLAQDSTVEHKVTAGTAGAGIGGAVATVVVWVLNTYVYGGAIPGEIAGAVDVIVPAALTFLGGWLAPHTVRTTGDLVTLLAALDDETAQAEPVAPSEG